MVSWAKNWKCLPPTTCAWDEGSNNVVTGRNPPLESCTRGAHAALQTLKPWTCMKGEACLLRMTGQLGYLRLYNVDLDLSGDSSTGGSAGGTGGNESGMRNSRAATMVHLNTSMTWRLGMLGMLLSSDGCVCLQWLVHH